MTRRILGPEATQMDRQGMEESMTDLSEKERNILIHALTGGQKREYRNHYVTGEGSDDYQDCLSLVKKGFMQRHERSWVCDQIFVVTESGRKILRTQASK